MILFFVCIVVNVDDWVCSSVHNVNTAYPHCWSAVGDLTETLPPTITHKQYLAATKGPGVDMTQLQHSLEMEEALRRIEAGEEEDFETGSDQATVSSSDALANSVHTVDKVIVQISCLL